MPGTGSIDTATVLHASVAWLIEKDHEVYATHYPFPIVIGPLSPHFFLGDTVNISTERRSTN